MLRALKNWAAEKDPLLDLSMEERMACGVGACLACVCKTTEKDEHSQVNKPAVCKDGPVFRAEEIDFDGKRKWQESAQNMSKPDEQEDWRLQ